MSIRISPRRIGRWSATHPWRALTIWFVFVAVCVALGAAAGTTTLSDGAVGESAQGSAVMDQQGLGGAPREYAYIHSTVLVSSDPRFAAAVRDVRRRIMALGLPVSETTSSDRRSVLVSAVPGQPANPAEASKLDTAMTSVPAAVAAAARAHPGLAVAETGDNSASDAQNRIVNDNLHRVGLLAIPVTLVVLLLAFGSVVAALVPLLLGLTAVAAGLGLLGPISHAFPVQNSAQTVILLIGLAVGVDYALFYVTRSRQERRAGAALHEALETTARTSGRTVVISGSIVAVAIAGMFLPGLKVLNGIAAGTIAVIFCAVFGSVTVLPAILALLGPKIDAGRVRPPGRRGRGGPRRPSLADRVLRRPLAAAGLVTALLLALAYPALSLHMAQPSPIALTAPDDPALQTLAAVQSTFPSAGEPAYVVVQIPARERAALRRELAQLEALAAGDKIAHPPFQITSNGGHTAAALTLPLTGNGANPASRQAVQTLRHTLIPQTVGHIAGARAYVTGRTAGDVDFTGQVRVGLPYAVAFVLVLAFGLLMAAFRSVVVPLTAVVLNLLSVAAAYSVLVAVFQHTWAEPVLRFRSNGTITAWLPLFLFVILFGLSMDYHVFILSRIKEAVTNGEPTRDAIRHSIGRTAGVITAAALVMVCVFALFGTLASLDLKQAGVGLAVAVLIDATVVRCMLLPATMTLLGDRNWYLPRWLARMPRLGLEAPSPTSTTLPCPARPTQPHTGHGDQIPTRAAGPGGES